jgi:hypothetical protein
MQSASPAADWQMANSHGQWILTLLVKIAFCSPSSRHPRLALEQIKVANMSNEIVAIPKLLDLLAIEDAIAHVVNPLNICSASAFDHGLINSWLVA